MPMVERSVKPLTEIKSVSEIVNRLESIVRSMPNNFENNI